MYPTQQTEMMDVGVFWSFTLNELMKLVFPSERCWTIFCFISECLLTLQHGVKISAGNLDANSWVIPTPIGSTGVMFMSCKVLRGGPMTVFVRKISISKWDK